MKWREDLYDALIVFSPFLVVAVFVAIMLTLDAIGLVE